MSARSLASVLTDFTPKRVPPDRVTVFTSVRERAAALDEVIEPAEEIVDIIDYELKVKEAFAAGRESGQAEAAVLFEAEKVRLEREFQEQLAAADAAFLADTGARLAAQLADGLSGIAADLSGSLAAALTPLVEASLRERAISGFVGELERLTKGLEGILIDVTGPRYLLDALRTRPEIDAIRFTFREANQSELTMKLDDVVIETRLGHLIDALKDQTR
ncbi:hypothetical protein SAMN04515648_4305 [Phyllobacterium sp. CL33Tsu]|uniref:hypothetical protein n=1 Tax=Phyllobacterium sp. CL33Tsu TaxID=1798191 RepID=UPI0008E0188A|nr:hypothetical protein [Phyllobacterium sp. CL33Tsu]SFJ49705.1 hypothetical protein SAMN04515648_4305 [Phyllobacterium sp. CL33Tsu]